MPLLTALPFVLAWLTSRPDRLFAGALIGAEDVYSYLAKMREGADGAWLYTLPYTSETHPGVPIFLLYLLLGKLAAGLQLPLVWVFHGARVLAGCLLVLMALRYARRLLPPALHRTGWWLIAFGSGLGWLGFFLGQPIRYPDISLPEMVTLPTVLITPHQPLAVACWLGSLLLAVRAEQRQRWAPALGAAALAAALAQSQPFQVITLSVTLGGWLAWRWWDRRHFPGWGARAAGACLALAAPVLLLGAWPLYTDPVLRGWTAQNISPTHSPGEWLLGLGLLGGFAAVGLWHIRAQGRRGSPDSPDRSLLGLTVIWVLASLILVHLPVPQQRRLSEGLSIPLAILATIGLARVVTRIRNERRRRLVLRATVSLTTVTNLLLLGLTFSGAVFTARPPISLTNGEVQAIAWLRLHADPNTVVLAAPETSLHIPTAAPVRTYCGHLLETLDSGQRASAARAFFRGALSPEERAALLRDGQVRYVFQGPTERKLGEAGAEGLTPLYEADGVAIYAVRTRSQELGGRSQGSQEPRRGNV